MSVDLVVEGYANNIHGVLRCGSLVLPCSLGRTGVSSDKHEGDGATPIGRFPIRQVFYRADRVPPPATKLPARALTKDEVFLELKDEVSPGVFKTLENFVCVIMPVRLS